MLSINEKSAGQEKLKGTLQKLVAAVALGELGHPVSGSTRYDVCVYDQAEPWSAR